MCRGVYYHPLMLVFVPFELAASAAKETKRTVETQSRKLKQQASEATVTTFSFFNPQAWEKKISQLSSKITVTTAALPGALFGRNALEEKLASWHVRRAVLYLLSRNAAAALVDLERSVALLPENKRFIPHYLIATIHQAQGAYDDAVKGYSAALSILEASKKAATIEGQIQDQLFLAQEVDNLLQGKLEQWDDMRLQARDTVTSFFTNFAAPSSSLHSAMEARVTEDAKQLEVLKEFNNQLKTVNSASIYAARGACFMNAAVDELQSALNDFQAAAREDPDNLVHCYNSGLALFYSRCFDQAYNQLTVCVEKFAKEPSLDASATAMIRNAYRVRAFAGQYLDKGDEVYLKDLRQAFALYDVATSIDELKQTLYYRLMPDSLIVNIMSYLPRRDVITAMTACRHLHRLISTTPYLWSTFKFSIKCVRDLNLAMSINALNVTNHIEYMMPHVNCLRFEEPPVLKGDEVELSKKFLRCFLAPEGRNPLYSKLVDQTQEVILRGGMTGPQSFINQRLAGEDSLPYSLVNFVLQFKNLKRLRLINCPMPLKDEMTILQIVTGLKLEYLELTRCEMKPSVVEHISKLVPVVKFTNN